MKSKIIAAGLLAGSMFILSCGGAAKKNVDTKEVTPETVRSVEDGMVPAIDTSNLKDESSILAAMQKVADARIADEKKQKEDANYKGHYLELTNLYSVVLKAASVYARALGDPGKSVEFSKKLAVIQNTMYGK